MEVKNGFTKPPLCPFCSEPWTEEMIDLEANASEGYASVGPESWGSLEIVCHKCKKLIYKKEW